MWTSFLMDRRRGAAFQVCVSSRGAETASATGATQQRNSTAINSRCSGRSPGTISQDGIVNRRVFLSGWSERSSYSCVIISTERRLTLMKAQRRNGARANPCIRVNSTIGSPTPDSHVLIAFCRTALLPLRLLKLHSPCPWNREAFEQLRNETHVSAVADIMGCI